MRIGDVLVVALVIVVLVILSPILIPLFIYVYVADKIEELRFIRYLARNSGKKYFCYTNKQSSQAYVRENILPFLPTDTEVIYLSDRGWNNLGDDSKFFAKVAWNMKKAEGGFPYVSKVSNGKLVTMSINNRLYSAIKRNKDADPINEKIRRFLESPIGR